MRPLTRDSLEVVWFGEWVDGILAYGLWLADGAPRMEFPHGAWPKETEWRVTQLGGSGWQVLLWDVRVRRWPSATTWAAAIDATLQAMRAAGATVSWCGLEGAFADPPSLFNESMQGGVWAALDSDGVMHGPPPLDGTFEPIARSVLARIREQSHVAALGRCEGRSQV